MSEELATLIAKRFISRRDVKAKQLTNGEYVVDTDWPAQDPTRLPWRMRDILAHLAGEKTYGHYLLNTDDSTKLFAFDIDLAPEGFWPEFPEFASVSDAITDDEIKIKTVIHQVALREVWLDRKHPARPWLKYQMRMLSGMLSSTIKESLGLECAVAYTGAKGVHVYGFTGPVPATVARDGALLVLEELGCFAPSRGQNFYKHENDDPVDGYSNFTIEVFPKQDSLDGKDLGNLMRLPLGRNLKSSDPTFFVDLTRPMADLQPHNNPVGLLTTGNPWLDNTGA